MHGLELGQVTLRLPGTYDRGPVGSATMRCLVPGSSFRGRGTAGLHPPGGYEWRSTTRVRSTRDLISSLPKI